MRNDETRDYNDEMQQLLLQFLISDPDLYVRSQNIIEPTYFTDHLKPVCRFIKTYTDTYNKTPTAEQVKAETSVDIFQLDQLTVADHSQWFLDTIEDFCRHKSMEQLIYDGPKLLQDGNYAELEKRSKENMMISLQTDLGTDYFANPLERLERMRDRSDMTSTGWKDVDRVLFGGLNRGEITMFAGGPGSGKSLFLQNLGLNWVQMGLNVLYITLELSEELVGLRIDAMVTDHSTKHIMKNFENTALEVSALYKRNKWGKLILKRMPISGTNSNTIRAYIREYEIQTNIKIDAICVDYLDLIHPNNKKINPSDLFIKDKYTSEELRDLAADLNVLMVTASQLNRGATNEQDLNLAHTAGGSSKNNTVDNFLGIYVTPEMKSRGEYQLQFLKTRSSSGVGSRVYIKYNPETMRMTDMNEDEQPTFGMNSGLAAIKNEISQKKKIVSSSMTEPEEVTTADKGSRIRDILKNINN